MRTRTGPDPDAGRRRGRVGRWDYERDEERWQITEDDIHAAGWSWATEEERQVWLDRAYDAQSQGRRAMGRDGRTSTPTSKGQREASLPVFSISDEELDVKPQPSGSGLTMVQRAEVPLPPQPYKP